MGGVGDASEVGRGGVGWRPKYTSREGWAGIVLTVDGVRLTVECCVEQVVSSLLKLGNEPKQIIVTGKILKRRRQFGLLDILLQTEMIVEP